MHLRCPDGAVYEIVPRGREHPLRTMPGMKILAPEHFHSSKSFFRGRAPVKIVRLAFPVCHNERVPAVYAVRRDSGTVRARSGTALIPAGGN